MPKLSKVIKCTACDGGNGFTTPCLASIQTFVNPCFEVECVAVKTSSIGNSQGTPIIVELITLVNL